MTGGRGAADVECACGSEGAIRAQAVCQDAGEDPQLPHTGNAKLVSQKVFIKLFCLSRFTHKSVNLFFIIVMVDDMLTNLWRS